MMTGTEKKTDFWDIGTKAVKNSFDITAYFLGHPSKLFLWISWFSHHCILQQASDICSKTCETSSLGQQEKPGKTMNKLKKILRKIYFFSPQGG